MAGMSTLPMAAASATAEPEISEKKSVERVVVIARSASNEPHQARGEIDEAPRYARLVHQGAREDEERNRDHGKAVASVEETQWDHHQGSSRGQSDDRDARGDQHVADGDPEKHQGDEKNENESFQDLRLRHRGARCARPPPAA